MSKWNGALAGISRPAALPSACSVACCAAAVGACALAASVALAVRRKRGDPKDDKELIPSDVKWLLGDDAQFTPLRPASVDENSSRRAADGPAPTMLTTLSRAPPESAGDDRDARAEATVVFIHGFGCNSLEFLEVARGASRRTGLPAFAYDRVVLVGASGKLDRPRTATKLAGELAALLRNRGVSPPYLLVGHSYGGLIARCFALSRPGDVAGLVLVDPAHEDQFERLPRDMTAAMHAAPILMRLFWLLAPAGIVGLLDSFSWMPFPPLYLYDKECRRAAQLLYSRRSVWSMVLAEWRGVKVAFEQMPSFRESHGPLRAGLPCTVVIAADRKYSPTLHPHGVTNAFEELHRPMVEEIGGRVILADESDHWVHLQSPRVVVDAICDVYQQFRENRNK